MQRMMRRLNDPAYLHTVSMNDLYENVYQSRPPIIDGLLCAGTYLLAGAPKVGKSFLVAQIAYHVSMGIKLWDYEVHKGTVLYLALEDDYQRLQERMFRMFGVEGTDDLHFAVWAKQIENGLDEQLEKFTREHPDTNLIIIDTLQKVREVGGDACSYANDYDIAGKFKQFADKHSICLLLVHHTRKQPAGDKFEMTPVRRVCSDAQTVRSCCRRKNVQIFQPHWISSDAIKRIRNFTLFVTKNA
jgi:RecA-family ATPase